MKYKIFLGLFVISLGIFMLISFFQQTPGYMDADYYFATALRIAKGEGFSEPFLWNYLDDPQGIPRPSHAYWMPLTSLLAAIGMSIFDAHTFLAARSGFLLLAGLVPPLTALLSFRLNQDRFLATLSGLLAVFAVFNLPFLPVTDTFALYMFLGVNFFLLLSSSPLHPHLPIHSFLLGLLAGLMHLSRADGILWVLVALLAGYRHLVMTTRRSRLKTHNSPLTTRNSQLLSRISRFASTFALILVGYLLIMGPWLIRNIQVFGTPLAPGGSSALWLTDYDELYSYPADQLTFSRWWRSGVKAILQDRLWALGLNLQTALAVQGSIILLPLIAWGAWHHRRDFRVQIGVFSWLLTFAIMTVVFPFAGARGGFFHSGAALQPLFWALAPVGLARFIDWGSRVRGWKKQQARLVFRGAVIVLVISLSTFIVGERVIGWGRDVHPWDTSRQTYIYMEQKLQDLGAEPSDIVMVNNPPGYYLASGRQAIVIPNGDPKTLLAAAERYRACYVLLEKNHPRPLNHLYNNPRNVDGFQLLWSDGLIHFLLVDGSP
jgi:hypothetical protein